MHHWIVGDVGRYYRPRKAGWEIGYLSPRAPGGVSSIGMVPPGSPAAQWIDRGPLTVEFRSIDSKHHWRAAWNFDRGGFWTFRPRAWGPYGAFFDWPPEVHPDLLAWIESLEAPEAAKTPTTPTIKPPIEVCQWATRQPIPGVAVPVDLDPRYARSIEARMDAAHRAAEAQAKRVLREVPTCPHGGEVCIFTTHVGGLITAYLQCEPCQDKADGADE